MVAQGAKCECSGSLSVEMPGSAAFANQSGEADERIDQNRAA